MKLNGYKLVDQVISESEIPQPERVLPGHTLPYKMWSGMTKEEIIRRRAKRLEFLKSLRKAKLHTPILKRIRI